MNVHRSLACFFFKLIRVSTKRSHKGRICASDLEPNHIDQLMSSWFSVIQNVIFVITNLEIRFSNTVYRKLQMNPLKFIKMFLKYDFLISKWFAVCEHQCNVIVKTPLHNLNILYAMHWLYSITLYSILIYLHSMINISCRNSTEQYEPAAWPKIQSNFHHIAAHCSVKKSVQVLWAEHISVISFLASHSVVASTCIVVKWQENATVQVIN